MIAFIDVEASSLGPHSYPIEVAWVREDGTGGSYLIKPQTNWFDWDDVSEQIHGITRTMLAADGLPAADVARRMHAALDGCDLHSDAPDADRIWLDVLMQTAGLPTPPVLHVYDALRPIFAPLAARMPRSHVESLAKSIVQRAEEGVESAGGPRHRAEPDARRHYQIWLAVKQQVAEALDGWP